MTISKWKMRYPPTTTTPLERTPCPPPIGRIAMRSKSISPKRKVSRRCSSSIARTSFAAVQSRSALLATRLSSRFWRILRGRAQHISKLRITRKSNRFKNSLCHHPTWLTSWVKTAMTSPHRSQRANNNRSQLNRIVYCHQARQSAKKPKSQQVIWLPRLSRVWRTKMTSAWSSLQRLKSF